MLHTMIMLLLSKGIQAGIHYPVPVHLQPAYKNRVKLASNMTVTETLSSKIVSLPIYPELSTQEAAEVIKAVKSFFEEKGCWAMEIIKTPLEGFLIIEPDVYEDDRGFFLEIYREERYNQAGITDKFVQENHSHSVKGVLRGMHFQIQNTNF